MPEKTKAELEKELKLAISQRAHYQLLWHKERSRDRMELYETVKELFGKLHEDGVTEVKTADVPTLILEKLATDDTGERIDSLTQLLAEAAASK